MGIPSYYKRLLDRYPKLITKQQSLPPTDTTLYFDFNCLVYQCLRDPKLPPYDGTAAWEDQLIHVVCKYVRNVWKEAGSPAKVFLAVDGVVPMAKIRQQRMRRFKSAWMATEEVRLGARSATQPKFDTNAITPGTAFMDRLAAALEDLAAKHAGWSVSTSHEAGEGEQKIMKMIRESPPKHAIVYGLDGDLIVLSLLHAENASGWQLMREAGEFSMKNARPDEFVFLNIAGLRDVLKTQGVNIVDYCAAMSLLGNDFVPHSLSVKLRDGGHDELFSVIRGKQLVLENGSLHWPAFEEIWKTWASTEKEMIAVGFAHKYKMRPAPLRTDYDRLMSSITNLPSVWKQESTVWSEGAGLTQDWEAEYRRWCLSATPAEMVAEYKRGLMWIWDYYNGRPVDMQWYYPWFLPPLWSDLVVETTPVQVTTFSRDVPPIQEEEQLAMVLPKESWGLLRNPKLTGLPAKAPAFWPTSFGFFSVGRRWFWECEACIPILNIQRLRTIMRV